jgi:hypothetical protein
MGLYTCEEHDYDDFIVVHGGCGYKSRCPVCELVDERDALTTEVEQLESKVDALESRISALEDELEMTDPTPSVEVKRKSPRMTIDGNELRINPT